MALLTLKDIGKIYVSEGNVAVGIRGVGMSFEKGEFVAVTGQSGSGKSTFLNVISGMDTYEEGEMFIEDSPTSHYMQSDWEEYREKYISFIFQDYNIIESFTVLENVELALMHIEDKKERRKRALELLRRVGLSSHIKQKGSKLSGGQKQRTVIARALAKDSPIILADEPTGNLDSATSSEIIKLLREVSRDKLLIIVTHNFDEVEEFATRHIRFFDGAVESDHTIYHTDVKESVTTEKKKPVHVNKNKSTKKDIRNGITLGISVFKSKPRLSFFLCMLMIVGTLGIFFVTSFCGAGIGEMFEKKYMFEQIDGRVVLTRQDGAVMTDDEINALANEYGASDFLKYDILLDRGSDIAISHSKMENAYNFRCTYGEDFGDDIIGTYPQHDDEVFLYVPISYKTELGEDASNLGYIDMENVKLKVTGVKYYVDNNIAPKCLFTREGFRIATAVYYLLSQQNNYINVRIYSTGANAYNQSMSFYQFMPSYEVEDGKIYVNSPELMQYYYRSDSNAEIQFNCNYYNYNWNYNSSGNMMNFNKIFDKDIITTTTAPSQMTLDNGWGYQTTYQVAISPILMRDIAEDVLSKSYRQVSFFYEDNDAAYDAAEKLCENGYIAVTSDTEYTPDALDAIGSVFIGIIMMGVWILSILFLAFFINLCSSRTIGAFKSDMAIMRSMGIPVKVVRIGMYVRMLISLIPAYILVIATAVLIFTTPQFNAMFTYLYAWQYLIIFAGMLLLTFRVTQKQIRKLFRQSVKKSLRGGAAND